MNNKLKIGLIVTVLLTLVSVTIYLTNGGSLITGAVTGLSDPSSIVKIANTQYSANGNVRMDISTIIPVVTSSNGSTSNLTYSFKKLGDARWLVNFCHKNHQKNYQDRNNSERSKFENIPVTSYAGSPSNLPNRNIHANQQCGFFTFKGNLGDAIKIGNSSTILEIQNTSVNFVVTPEYKSCSYLFCESEILLQNNETYEITFNATDLNIFVEGTDQEMLYYDYTYLQNVTYKNSTCGVESGECNVSYYTKLVSSTKRIATTETVIKYKTFKNLTFDNYTCDEESGECNITGNYTNMTLTKVSDPIDHEIMVSANSSKTFYIQAIMDTLESQFKYNATFDYLGTEYLIDPFFNTTNSTLNAGSFNRTELNETGFLQLNDSDILQEFPNGTATAQFEDLIINMTGNVLYFKFNNDSTYTNNHTHIYDWSGNGNDGICNYALNDCPSYVVDGKLGAKFNFDDVDDYYNVDDDSSLNFSTDIDFTIATWFKRVGSTGDFEFIADKRTSDNNGWIFFFSTDNKLYLAVGSADAISSSTITDTEWHHLVGVADRDGNSQIYIDGLADGSPTDISAAEDISKRVQLTIGGRAFSQPNHIAGGDLDELGIWNRTLSPVEIQDIYNIQKGSFYLRGNYESEIFDATSSVNWTNISWQSSALGEFSNYGENETNFDYFSSGQLDMTHNRLLFHFNNNSESENETHVFDYSGNNNNATWKQGGVSNGSKKLGDFSGHFDGIDDVLFMDDEIFDNDDKGTISVWVYPTVNAQGTIVSAASTTSADNFERLHLRAVGSKLYPAMQHTATNIERTTNEVPLNEWSHITVTSNGTFWKIYLNGIEETLVNDGGSNTGGWWADISAATTNYHLGVLNRSSGATQYFGGYIDELAIWNITLLDNEAYSFFKRAQTRLNVSVKSCDDASCLGEEYTDLTNNTSPQFFNLSENRYFRYRFKLETDDGEYSPELYNISVGYESIVVPDTRSPAVNISTPSNGSNFSSGLQIFNVSVTDISSTVDTVLFMFNTNTTSFNVTATNISNNWSANVNISTLTEGIHAMIVWANDSSNNLNDTENITFTIDRTPPTVTISSPSNGSNFSTGFQNFNVTVNDENLSVSDVFFQFSNGSNSFNVSATNTSGLWGISYNVSELAEGIQTITVIANDTLNNLNNTENITIAIDRTAPLVTIIAPVNNKTFTSGTMAFNATVVDGLLDVSTVIFQFANSTAFNITASNVSGVWNVSNIALFADGDYYVTLLANDSLGNFNNSVSLNFSIDTSVEDSSDEGSSGAGGAGSSTEAEVEEIIEEVPLQKDFVLSLHNIEKHLIIGKNLTEKIIITNDGNEEVTFLISLEGNISQFIDIPTSIIVGPGKSKDLEYTIRASKIGLHNGALVISEKRIPFTLLITGQSGKLLDLTLTLPELEYFIGETMNFTLDVANFGTINRYDIIFVYTLIDNNDEILIRQEETLAVEDSLTFSRSFLLPQYLEGGFYTIKAEAFYDNIITTASSSVMIFEPEEVRGAFVGRAFFVSIAERGTLASLLVVVILVVIISTILLIIKLMQRKKKYAEIFPSSIPTKILTPNNLKAESVVLLPDKNIPLRQMSQQKRYELEQRRESVLARMKVLLEKQIHKKRAILEIQKQRFNQEEIIKIKQLQKNIRDLQSEEVWIKNQERDHGKKLQMRREQFEGQERELNRKIFAKNKALQSKKELLYSQELQLESLKAYHKSELVQELKKLEDQEIQLKKEDFIKDSQLKYQRKLLQSQKNNLNNLKLQQKHELQRQVKNVADHERELKLLQYQKKQLESLKWRFKCELQQQQKVLKEKELLFNKDDFLKNKMLQSERKLLHSHQRQLEKMNRRFQFKLRQQQEQLRIQESQFYMKDLANNQKLQFKQGILQSQELQLGKIKLQHQRELQKQSTCLRLLEEELQRKKLLSKMSGVIKKDSK